MKDFKNLQLILWATKKKIDIWQGSMCWTVDIEGGVINPEDEKMLRSDGFGENRIKEINKWVKENTK